MAKTLTVYLAADLKKFNAGMDDAERRARGLGGTMSGMLGPALIGAAAAAGALAIKLGVDGVQAAIEDEAAASKLAQTLTNLGLAHDTAPVEEYIDSLQRSLGVADTELRPAYDRLVRSIGNTEDANDALALALDVSAGSGKSLQAVTEALGKAYDGNTAGLSRLGAGIDAATLKTGDMQAITAELARTFGGQASNAAQTYQGQINRLKVGAEELTEAFGTGLLAGLGDTDGQTQDLMDSMKELEPVIRNVGEALGSTFGDLAFLAGQIGNLTSEIDQLIPSLGDTGENASTLDKALGGLSSVLFNTGGSVGMFAQALRLLQEDVLDTNEAQTDLTSATVEAALAAGKAESAFEDLTPELDANAKSALDAAGSYLTLYERIANADRAARDFAGTSGTVSSAIAAGVRNPDFTGRDDRFDKPEKEKEKQRSLQAEYSKTDTATNKVRMSTDELTAAYRRQSKGIEDTRGALTQHLEDLENLTKQAEDYANGIRGGLQAGLDLAAAYSGQFTKEGEKTGISLLEGFNRQVAQVEWFGNVLTAMKAQGADAGFIQEVAGLGPGIGGPLGEQLINDGLVPTMSDKWVNVQNKINDLGVQLVPEFLNQGIADAQALVSGMAQQLAQEVPRLSKLGKEIGKPVGASFKAQIFDDIAEALRQVEASSSAARAEKVAQASARQAAITETAVAQAISSIVAKADARTGRPTISLPPFLVAG